MREKNRKAAQMLRLIGLGNLLDAAREKVQKENGVRGNVTITIDDDKIQHLANLVGFRHIKEIGNGVVKVALRHLDAKLQDSYLHTTLWEVLEADSGRIVTKEERQLEIAEDLACMLNRLKSVCPQNSSVQNWILSILGDGPSGRRFRRAYKKDPKIAENSAMSVAQALAKLPLSSPELLAVFAAKVTGDPHTFDSDQLTGRLLLAAIEEQFGFAPQDLGDTQKRILLLGVVGLDVDGLSSTVLAAYLPETHHPVLNTMAQSDMGWPLPLHSVRSLQIQKQLTEKVYVLENPQAFEYLTHGLSQLARNLRPILLCTGGFLSAAAVLLLDGLHEAGCTIYYGGDFDCNGLAIARGLYDRYNRLVFWRMSHSDYNLAICDSLDKRFTKDDIDWLNKVSGELETTARAMINFGKPAYQERLVNWLMKDVLER